MTTWGDGLAFWEALCLPVSYELGVYAEQAHPYINNSIRGVYFLKNARLHCGHAKGRSEVSTVNLSSARQLRERSWRVRCSALANVFLQNLHWYEGVPWPSAGCLGSSIASAELIAIHATVYPASRT
jgi:hypothetical protein